MTEKWISAAGLCFATLIGAVLGFMTLVILEKIFKM